MAKTDADLRQRLNGLADQVAALAGGDLLAEARAFHARFDAMETTLEALMRLLPDKGITRADVYAMERTVKTEREAKRG